MNISAEDEVQSVPIFTATSDTIPEVILNEFSFIKLKVKVF